MAAQGGLFAPDAAPSREALRAAQARLMADRSLQFSFADAPAPPKPHPLPKWLADLLRFLGHLLGHAGPAFQWIFYGGLAAAVALVLFFIVRELIRARWPGLFKRKAKPKAAPVDWRPDVAVARALLDEADRLAAAGAFAEAAHLLLYRSIEDIEGRRPRLVRPAYTAREIATLEDVPPQARITFSRIAEVVERSFFGGREVDAAGYQACRKAYEDFAFPGAWA